MKRLQASLLAFCLLVAATQVHAVDLGLVSTLVSKLGVTQKQAEGGAGSILDYAKNNLSKDDFAKVASALPETESLLKAVPRSEGSSIDSLGGALGGGGGTLGTVAGLASLGGTFQKLGLSSDMVGKFVPIILDYAQSKGGAAVSGTLGKVLTPGTPSAAASQPPTVPPAATLPAATPTPGVKTTQPAKPTATKPPAKKTSSKAPAPTKTKKPG